MTSFCRICGSTDLVETAKDWRNRPRLYCQNCGSETIQSTLPGDCWRCNGEGLVYQNPGWPDPQTETDQPCPECGGRDHDVPAASSKPAESASAVLSLLLASTAAGALTQHEGC